MTVRDLFISLGFKVITEALLHTHNRNEVTVKNLIGFKMAYDILCNIEFDGEGGDVTFSVTPRQEWDDYHSLPLLADGVEGELWVNLVGKTVVKPADNPFTDAELAGAILWGATYYGFTPRQRFEYFDELFASTKPTPNVMQVKRLRIKRLMQYNPNRKIRDELKRELKSPVSDYCLSLDVMEWRWKQLGKLRRNRSKRKREYRMENRINELEHLDEVECILDSLRKDIKIIPEEISDKIRSATSIVKKSYESCTFGKFDRIDYISDLLLNSDYQNPQQSTLAGAAEYLCVILASEKNPCSDDECKRIGDILAAFLKGVKCYLFVGNDNSLGCEIRLKIIAMNDM